LKNAPRLIYGGGDEGSPAASRLSLFHLTGPQLSVPFIISTWIIENLHKSVRTFSIAQWSTFLTIAK